MSLLPYVIDELIAPPRHHHHFGLGFYPEDLWISPNENRLTGSRCLRPWLSREHGWPSNIDGAEKKSHIGKDGFQVCLDVQHFQPNEISVKTVDNSIEVEAKHEERQDNHGYISRQFKRRYTLPEGFKAQDVVSSLSSDGILTLKAPPATPAVEGNVRHVQIQQTGPARLNVGNQENKEVKKADAKNGK